MIVPKETCQDRYLELKSKYAAKWIAQWGKGEGHAKMTTDPDVGNGRGSARYMCLAHNKFCARSFVHRNMSTRRLEVWQVDENMPTLSHAFPPPQVAAFLICLWELRHGKDAAQHVRFVDLGAGNGFLVYLLAEEGYSGYGVDVSSRGIWSMYGERTHLERATLDAPSAIFDVCTGRLVVPDGNGMSTSAPPTTELWLVGNHSDELTPWLPIIAAKSNLYAYERYGLTRNHCHFFVLPCCFHDLRGDRNAFGRTIPFSENIADSESLSGKYGHYIRWIEWIAENICGFRMQREWLRIPSTKNVCLVASDGPQQRGEGWREIMDAITDLTSSVVFAPRLSDKEKGELRDMHKRRQTSINGDGTFLEDDETVAARQELLGELGGFDFSDQEQ